MELHRTMVELEIQIQNLKGVLSELNQMAQYKMNHGNGYLSALEVAILTDVLVQQGVSKTNPYLLDITFKRRYNPEYGDGRICKCGHQYSRHFDLYEGPLACSCKYCGCDNFREELIVGTV